MVMAVFFCRRTVTVMATSPVCRSSSLLKTSSLLSCCRKRKRSTSTGWVFTLPARAHITHSRRFNSCMGLLFGFLFFLSFLDPGDGGLQSDRWARGPEAVCCNCKPGTENCIHGVSDQLTHPSEKLEEESLTSHK